MGTSAEPRAIPGLFTFYINFYTFFKIPVALSVSLVYNNKCSEERNNNKDETTATTNKHKQKSKEVIHYEKND